LESDLFRRNRKSREPLLPRCASYAAAAEWSIGHNLLWLFEVQHDLEERDGEHGNDEHIRLSELRPELSDSVRTFWSLWPVHNNGQQPSETRFAQELRILSPDRERRIATHNNAKPLCAFKQLVRYGVQHELAVVPPFAPVEAGVQLMQSAVESP
jgi:hypothetical protein